MAQPKTHSVALAGGVNEKLPSLSASENFALQAINVECKETGKGFRRILGYDKWDSNEVTDATYIGSGDIRGIAFFNDACYVARNTSNDGKCAIFKSTGSGWSVVKSGLLADGNYEFDKYSFGGTEKLYGVDGVNPFFSIDSSDTYTAITVWASGSQAATHLAMHRNRAWVTRGAEVTYSDVGDPTAFTDYAASGTIYTKETITAISPLVGGVIGVFSRNNIAYLSGTGSESTLSAEFLTDHGNNVGARINTVQTMGSRTFFLGDPGIIDLAAVQEFGDFGDATISDAVYETLRAKLGTETASCVVRKKDQYRLFFSDGSGIIVSLRQGQFIGLTWINFPIKVNKAVSSEYASGVEVILFGSSTGYVYEMESGNQFDGENLTASLIPAFTPCRYPRRNKRFRFVIFDMDSTEDTSFQAEPLVKFGASANLASAEISVGGADALLGDAVLGEATLGGDLIQEGVLDIPVEGDYITMLIYSSSGATDAPWDINTLIYEFHLGRKRRYE